MTSMIRKGNNYVMVSRGIRIDPHNLTVDMSVETAQKARKVLLAAHSELKGKFDAEHLEILRLLVDGIAGPLSKDKASTG